MSFQDILIFRDYQLIDGFVQIPPNDETDKTRVTEAEALASISGSTTTRLSLGSGKPQGAKYGQQEFLRLPGINPNTWYTTDPVDDVAGD